jgi:hypothetical protein
VGPLSVRRVFVARANGNFVNSYGQIVDKREYRKTWVNKEKHGVEFKVGNQKGNWGAVVQKEFNLGRINKVSRFASGAAE